VWLAYDPEMIVLRCVQAEDQFYVCATCTRAALKAASMLSSTNDHMDGWIVCNRILVCEECRSLSLLAFSMSTTRHMNRCNVWLLS